MPSRHWLSVVLAALASACGTGSGSGAGSPPSACDASAGCGDAGDGRDASGPFDAGWTATCHPGLLCPATECAPCGLYCPPTGGTCCSLEGPCQVDTDCCSGTYCVNGTCAALGTGACTSSTECPTNQLCPAGSCCVPPGPEGSVYTVCNMYQGPDCCPGAYCRLTSVQDGYGVCTVGVGGSCAMYPTGCGPGGQCLNGQCCLSGPGQTCTSSSECCPGTACLQGTCSM
jgi:hypothetical protein